MDARQLKTLLAALTSAGVSFYRDADVTLQFGATFQAPAEDVEGETDAGTPLLTPDDWRAKILKTYEKAAPRKGSV
jgi:hypothetical protein